MGPFVKSGNLSERGFSLTYKRSSHELSNKLSPFGSKVDLEFQKKVLK
jgi:hypothetical protein